MSRVPMWRRYLRFFGPDVGADVREELRFHIETKTRELIEQGLSPDDARREAMRHFGDVSEVTDLCRRIGEEHVRRIRLRDRIATWWYDLRHAIRSLLRTPRFTLVAVATLAGGLSGTVSLFSLVDAWVIRSVRFPEPRQLIFADGLNIRQGREITVSFADYVDIAARAKRLQSLSAWTQDSFTLSVEGPAERVSGARVSTNLFETLRVQPAQGRGFLPREGDFGQHHVAIVSDGFWKTRLNGDRSVIGSKIDINREPYIIVGVLPEHFHLTLVGRANVWVPLAPSPEERSQRRARSLQMIGRMKPGVTIAQAREELKSITAQLAAAYPNTNRDTGSALRGLSDEIGRHTGQDILLIVFGVTLGLLLIACSNIASLLLVRALARQRQAAIQLSVGASRGRLIRQRLMETLTLFLIAAGVGAAVASWANGLLTGLIPYENRGYLPDYGQAPVNWTAFGFVLLICLVTGVVFGLAPAMEATRADLASVLKESGSSLSQSAKSRRLRLALVIGQVVLATVLASATILLVRSFHNILGAPQGFDSSGVLTFRVSLDEHEYANPQQRQAFFETLLSGVKSTQFSSAAIAVSVPFGYGHGESSFRLPGLDGVEPIDVRRLPSALFNVVSPEYFSVLTIPLLGGRVFQDRDSRDTKLAAIVNQPFVTQYLNGRNPIGQPVVLGRMGNRAADIVGVVGGTREDGDPGSGKPQIYVPFAQAPDSETFVIARTTRDPLKLVPDVRRSVAAIDPAQPVYDIKTLDERLNEAFAPFRILSGLLLWFGSLAVALTGVGMYGVVAFSVSQRTREIGIRAALGASPSRLQMLFLRQGIVILLAGLLPGLCGAFAVSIALQSLLSEIAPLGWLAPLLFTGALISSVVLLATLLPARRAAAIHALNAIRYE